VVVGLVSSDLSPSTPSLSLKKSRAKARYRGPEFIEETKDDEDEEDEKDENFMNEDFLESQLDDSEDYADNEEPDRIQQ
jgi:hypothetical protein